MSADNNDVKPPTLFWVISIISLLWYLFGTMAFYGTATATPESLAPMVANGDMTQAYADWVIGFPGWVKAMFGIAVLAGVLGSIALLLRKSWAAPLFMLSLAAALLMYLYNYVLSGNAGLLPTFDHIMTVMVLAITSFMIWFSRKKKAKGYLS